MTINGNRNFKGNDGRRYRVENTPKRDIDQGRGKYYLKVLENGFYRICCDICFDILYFDTIKAAQREVLYSGGNLFTL